MPIPEGWVFEDELLDADNLGRAATEPGDDEEKPGKLTSISRGLTHGTLGLAEDVGIGLEYFGHRVDDPGISALGERIGDYWGKKAQNYLPSQSIRNKNVVDNPVMMNTYIDFHLQEELLTEYLKVIMEHIHIRDIVSTL